MIINQPNRRQGHFSGYYAWVYPTHIYDAFCRTTYSTPISLSSSHTHSREIAEGQKGQGGQRKRLSIKEQSTWQIQDYVSRKMGRKENRESPRRCFPAVLDNFLSRQDQAQLFISESDVLQITAQSWGKSPGDHLTSIFPANISTSLYRTLFILVTLSSQTWMREARKGDFPDAPQATQAYSRNPPGRFAQTGEANNDGVEYKNLKKGIASEKGGSHVILENVACMCSGTVSIQVSYSWELVF